MPKNGLTPVDVVNLTVLSSTILDDFSRYITCWRLTTTMAASDVTDTLQDALDVTGLKEARVITSPDCYRITVPATSVVNSNDG